MAGRALPSSRTGGKPEEHATPDLDLSEGIDPVARAVIDRGEQALKDLRKHTVKRWCEAGAAWKTLQLVVLHRSRSNNPTGTRYNKVYAVLVHGWPALAKGIKARRAERASQPLAVLADRAINRGLL